VQLQAWAKSLEQKATSALRNARCRQYNEKKVECHNPLYILPHEEKYLTVYNFSPGHYKGILEESRKERDELYHSSTLDFTNLDALAEAVSDAKAEVRIFEKEHPKFVHAEQKIINSYLHCVGRPSVRMSAVISNGSMSYIATKRESQIMRSTSTLLGMHSGLGTYRIAVTESCHC
jgi:hypothetical protein